MITVTTESVKHCLACGKDKPLSAFGVHKRRIGGLYSTCKECKAERWRTKYANDQEFRDRAKQRSRRQSKSQAAKQRHTRWCGLNPDKIKVQKRRSYLKNRVTVAENQARYRKLHPRSSLATWLWYNYRIRLPEYEALLSAQNGKCAICKRTPDEAGVSRLSVDHDHKSRRVRGLLCRDCNTGIARFRDDLDLLVSAIAYLS